MGLNKSTASRRHTRSIRADDAEVNGLLDELDEADESCQGSAGGGAKGRYSYRIPGLRVQLRHPGAMTAALFLAPTRWISEENVAFLHGSFVHAGTPAHVQLITLHGSWEDVDGVVSNCRYVRGQVHELEVEFARRVDLALYCSPAALHRVLLAEDDSITTPLAKMYLSELNAEVDHVTNGAAAVEMALKQPYDLVLMDGQLPEVSGFEALAILRGKGYFGPIVAFCAIDREADRQQYLDAGFDEHVVKPFQRQHFVQLLDSLRTELVYSEYQHDKSMEPLIAAFVSALPQKITDLRKATQENDLHRLLRLAEALREGGSSYGFDAITNAAAALRTSIWTSDTDVRYQVDQLSKVAALVRGPAART